MHINKKILIAVAVLAVIVVAGFGAYLAYKTPAEAPNTDNNPEGSGVVCTMEAKQCPDGSYVGRHGPRCEFAACPTVATSAIYQGVATASFEGDWKLEYTLNYDKAHISIATTSKKNEVAIKDLDTGSSTKIFISYEGGRGYSAQDFWDNIGKKSCSNCVPIPRFFLPIKYTIQALPVYTSPKNIWFYVAPVDPSISGESWIVFVQSLPKENKNLLDTVNSLTIMQSLNSLSNVQAPVNTAPKTMPKPY